MAKSPRQIVVDLPAGVGVEGQADHANAIWAICPDDAEITVVGPDSDAVNQAMDDRWKGAPEFRGGRWRMPL
jgi:hypothetical protein